MKCVGQTSLISAPTEPFAQELSAGVHWDTACALFAEA